MFSLGTKAEEPNKKDKSENKTDQQANERLENTLGLKATKGDQKRERENYAVNLRK